MPAMKLLPTGSSGPMPTRTALLLLALAGCATAAAPPVWVARPLGTLQCEPPGPRTPKVLAQALRDAGVTVSAEACGHDGRMRPAVCGAPDGRLALAQIPGDQLTRARTLGWVPLSEMPDAQRLACD
ncbi:MAG: hypothetical protein Fur0014_20230 [Rubrivivax sp.]